MPSLHLFPLSVYNANSPKELAILQERGSFFSLFGGFTFLALALKAQKLFQFSFVTIWLFSTSHLSGKFLVIKF